jgi:PAS domain S-box-containing protein
MKRLFPAPTAGSIKSERMIFMLAEVSVVSFAVFRILDINAGGSSRLLITILAASPLGMIVIALIYLLRRTLNQAFIMPMALYLMFLAGCFFADDFLYFYPVCTGICGLGALYLDQRRLWNYIIISNIISLILICLKIPVHHSVKTILFTEVLMQWSVSVFVSVFIYLITAFAVDKNNAATKARDSFSALLSSSPNRIILLDSGNLVTYISESFMNLTNLKDPAGAIGRPVFDLLKDTSLEQMIHDSLNQENLNQETREIILDGKQYYFNIITSKLSGETKGRLINIIDVTPLMKAKFEAEAASQSKSAFLATMSHEIRTPLNAIIGLSEIELQKKLPAEARQDLEKIYASGESLLSIINDILDISKIEAGSFALVPVEYDVPSMINDTIHLNIVRIGSKHIMFKLEIDHSIPVKLFGDEVRVRQILNNLLSNAFKYTEEGSVMLSVEWEPRGGDAWIIFTVSDTGRGIRQEDMPRLFGEYAQFDIKANHHIEGTGLGLSITKELVELMGGVISVESEYGKGSVFTARIMQRVVDASPVGEATAKNLQLFRFMESRRSQGLKLMRSYMPYGRVLVVDDVETNLDVAKGLLLPYGLSIDYASSGVDAIDKIRAGGSGFGPRYDLVLMDHMMPVMDGIEAVRIIRGLESDYAKMVPIIALTANALTGNEEMFLSNGFNAYISKPIDIMQLDVALNTWVRSKQSKDVLMQAEMENTARELEESQKPPGILDNIYIEGIDLAIGKERYSNETAYLDIIRSYHLHTPALLGQLRELVRENLSEYVVVIHGLKGSSYGICANSVGKKAEELETAARAGNFEKVKAETNSFIEMAELLLLDLEDLLRKASEAKGAKRRDARPDAGLLEKFLDAARRYKTTQMEDILAELESCDYDSGGELVAWLREQIDNLEYDAIRERLEKEEASA